MPPTHSPSRISTPTSSTGPSPPRASPASTPGSPTHGQTFGGIGQAKPGDDPGISFFVRVDSVAATIEKATRLGGGVWWGPAEFPDGMVTGCLK